MTFIKDGAPFQFPYGRDDADTGQSSTVAIGWLDAGEPVSTGNVPPRFVEKLRNLCADGINRMRGLHACTFCPRHEDPDDPYALQPSTWSETTSGTRYVVGSAEIRVKGRGGIVYAAPD